MKPRFKPLTLVPAADPERGILISEDGRMALQDLNDALIHLATLTDGPREVPETADFSQAALYRVLARSTHAITEGERFIFLNTSAP